MYIRKAFIVDTKIVSHVAHFWQDKFPGKLYVNYGPKFVGDNKVFVDQNETIIELFSSEAETWFITNIVNNPLAQFKEVEIIWESN